MAMRTEDEVREMRRDYQESFTGTNKLILQELKRAKPDIDRLMEFHRHQRRMKQYIHLLDLVLGKETGWMPSDE